MTTVPLSLRYLIKGQMRFMRENGFDVTMISAEGNDIESIKLNEGCGHLIFPLTRKITPLQDFIALIKLFIFLKKEKPFIIHTHTPKAGIIGMLAGFLAGVPNRLHTVAGLPLLEAKGVKRKILDFVEELTYKCSTKVYPNSFELKKIILENKFIKKNKLKVIAKGSSNGIDTSYFNPNLFSKQRKEILKKKLKIKKSDFVFVFVGRIVGDKGINELVKAFIQIALNNKNFKLLLVGHFESELDPLDRNTLSTIESEDQILFVGFQKDVRLYLSISDVLTFPSYREGFPNVVMQAGAMGLPAIVTDINGCNEIIEDEHNGLIIPSKDINSLKNAMLNVFENKTLYKNCTENARKVICSKYEQKLYWDALLHEYKTFLN